MNRFFEQKVIENAPEVVRAKRCTSSEKIDRGQIQEMILLALKFSFDIFNLKCSDLSKKETYQGFLTFTTSLTCRLLEFKVQPDQIQFELQSIIEEIPLSLTSVN